MVIIVFVVSIVLTNIQRKNKNAETEFKNLAAQIENHENSIDAHLLYNDNDGARADLLAAQNLINSLPKEKGDQKIVYDQLENKLREQSEKIQKLVKVTQVEKTNDLSGLNLNNIFLISTNIYASDQTNVYGLTINSSSSSRSIINGAISLTKVSQNPSEKSYLYYLNSNQIIKFDLKKKTSSIINLTGTDQSVNLNTFRIYGTNGSGLYALAQSANQIYKYSKSTNGFSTKTNWLKETIDLSQASDISVTDGYIYVLKNNGEVQKFFQGKKENFNAPALLPAMTNASKIYVGVKYIYIFESDTKRLAVLNKINGSLLNQYEVDSLNNIKDFTVNEEAKQAYFLTAEAIYRINLNQ